MRLLLLGLLVAATAHAQTGTISGTVRDAATGEALPGANVRVDGTHLGAATDIDGRFVIRDVPVGTYDVVASFAGYEIAAQRGVRIPLRKPDGLSFDLRTMTLCYCYVGYVPPLLSRSPFTSRVWTGRQEVGCCSDWDEVDGDGPILVSRDAN